MRSDDRFEPIPVNCHCANLCPQLANAFRTRTEQECALKVAFGPFAELSGNGRYLRAPCEGGAFQWVQAPPGDRSSRKQPEQSWR
jgi:hypothetical protein